MAHEFTYILLAEGSGRVKIGETDDVKNRLQHIRTHCPYPIRLLCQVPSIVISEKQLHFFLEEFKIHLEWFEAVPFVLDVAGLLASDSDGQRIAIERLNARAASRRQLAPPPSAQARDFSTFDFGMALRQIAIGSVARGRSSRPSTS